MRVSKTVSALVALWLSAGHGIAQTDSPVRLTNIPIKGGIATYATVLRGASVRVVSPISAAYVDTQHLRTSQNITQSSGLFLLDLVPRHSPEVLLSGGYLSSFAPVTPLGLLKVAGRELSRLHNSWLTTAIFCSRSSGREWAIFESTERQAITAFEDCVQGGPIVVENGISRYSSDISLSSGEKRLVASRQSQGFVCTQVGGNLLLVYLSPMTLDIASDFLATDLGCQRAMRLTGAETAGLWSNGTLFGNSQRPLASAIAVFR